MRLKDPTSFPSVLTIFTDYVDRVPVDRIYYFIETDKEYPELASQYLRLAGFPRPYELCNT